MKKLDVERVGYFCFVFGIVHMEHAGCSESQSAVGTGGLFQEPGFSSSFLPERGTLPYYLWRERDAANHERLAFARCKLAADNDSHLHL